jgi:hypothetical protein
LPAAAALAAWAAASFAACVVAAEVDALVEASDEATLPTETVGTPTEVPTDEIFEAFRTVCASMKRFAPEEIPASPALMVPSGAKR